MDVFELYDLANWYRRYFKGLRKVYSDLHNAVSNNANQPSKVPVEAPLVALLEFLQQMNVAELSLQQLTTLETLGVDKFVGHEGARWVEATIRTEAYDPATTDRNIATAISSLNTTNERLTAFSTSIEGMGLAQAADQETKEGRVTVRVGFKNEASIDNVKDWKVSGDDWFQIIRGLALAVGEAPENTKIVGASNGSIILVLSATYAVSKLLASIAKHITGTAKDILGLQIELENLRQKKILTKTMEAEFQRLQEEKRAGAIKSIEAEVAKQLPKKADGETTTALSKSIERLLKFGEKGGDIDLVAPTEPDTQAPEGAPNEMLTNMRSVRNLILEYQQERESVKLLSDKANGSGAAE